MRLRGGRLERRMVGASCCCWNLPLYIFLNFEWCLEFWSSDVVIWLYLIFWVTLGVGGYDLGVVRQDSLMMFIHRICSTLLLDHLLSQPLPVTSTTLIKAQSMIEHKNESPMIKKTILIQKLCTKILQFHLASIRYQLTWKTYIDIKVQNSSRNEEISSFWIEERERY